MTDSTLARVARMAALEGREWLCRTRLEHLDWRPLLAAGLIEQSAGFGHVRLTPLGRARARRAGALPIRGGRESAA